MKHLYIAIAAIVLALVSTAPAPAQEQQAPKVAKIEPYIIEKFVKYVVVAVDQANETGNYTVLHALGSPDFMKTSPADLFTSFEAMRKARVDLSIALLYKPKLSTKPEIVNGVLHAAGYFPTEPLKINFDIVWIVSGGRLLLHGLALNPSKDVAQAAPASNTKVDKPASADSN